MKHQADAAEEGSHRVCLACGFSTLAVVFTSDKYRVYRCSRCTMAQSPEIVAYQAGSSRVASSATPQEKVGQYAANMLKMKERCLRSLALRLPILEQVLGKPVENVCEIGCANGVGFYPFHQKGVRWLGLETDARWIAHGERHGIPIVAKDMDEVEDQFDLIYAHQVLEHVHQPFPFVSSIRTKLKPGGIVHFAVPNHSGFTALKRRALPFLTPLEYGFIQYPYHMRAYNKRSLQALLQRAGFTEVVVRAICHTDECWGEWDAYAVPILANGIFSLGAAVGLGTLLIGHARAPRT